MKLSKIQASLMAAAAMTMAGCTSYEIDMPENPEPAVGHEVSTMVVYEANPRLFSQNNECFPKLTERLDNIASMGCDVIWIMPIYEAGELESFGSPYCIRDFKKLNSKIGTADQFKSLVDKAHGLGMKVMLDWVANHTSWDNAWIKDHPDWYKHDENNHIVSPDNWPDVAQLDYSNADVAAAMQDAMLYWVNTYGIDGFRCDYADGVPESFWTSTIEKIHAVNEDFIMLAESANTNFFNCGFTWVYDWNSGSTVSGAFTGGKASEVVSEAASALSNLPEGKSMLRFVFNHDTASENAVDNMFGSVEAIPAAYVAVSMLGGTPLMYTTMEIAGLTGAQSFFDYKDFSASDFSAALAAEYGAINKAFKASAEVRRGVLADYSTKDVVCFTRSIPGQTLLVAVNTTGSVQTVRTPISFSEATMTDLIENKAVTVPMNIELQPYAYTILMN
ncbi:MAG: alpha-amylase [Muribaculaceae bacterium]|nr:alpha-amylase [Muribaculaceae bacterium]